MSTGSISQAAFDRIGGVLTRALSDLSEEQLRIQPAGDQSNPIGWLAFHLCRVHDRNFSLLLGEPESWESDGWADRFGLPVETGTLGRATLEEVRAFNPTNSETLLAYWEAARERSRQFLETLSDADLDNSSPISDKIPPNETIKISIARVTGDTIQHIGQIAYARGLVDRHGWYGA